MVFYPYPRSILSLSKIRTLYHGMLFYAACDATALRLPTLLLLLLLYCR